MCRSRIYLDDVIMILEEGTNCQASSRRTGTIEKAMRIHSDHIKVVVVRSVTRWNNEECWLIIHVGRYRER